MEIAAMVLGAFIAACMLLVVGLAWYVARLARRAREYRPQRRHAKRLPMPRDCSCGRAWSGDESAPVDGCPVHDPTLRNRSAPG